MATVLMKKKTVYLLFICQMHATTQMICQSVLVVFEPCVLSSLKSDNKVDLFMLNHPI